MKKLTNMQSRWLNALIWVPVLVVFSMIWTPLNHLPFNIIMIMFGVIGGWELGSILKNNRAHIKRGLYPVLGGIFPLWACLEIYFPILINYEAVLITALLMTTLTSNVLVRRASSLNGIVDRVGGLALAVFYPGFFIAYAIRISSLNQATYMFLFFLILVLLNDSLAYFVGMALGARTKTKGFILVSPNKSLIGFVGGLIGSVVVALLFFRFKNNLFGGRAVDYAITVGIVVGLAAMLGDLFESAIKRGAGVKDSGGFFLGRGGVLDSIDSLLFAAPIFYFFMKFA